MCGDALLVAPIVQEGGEVEIALPPGGWYDLNTRAALCGAAGAALQGGARSVSGVRARRLRAAARPRRPAHRRDRRRKADRAALGVRQACDRRSTALAGRASTIADGGRTGGSRRRRRTGAFLRRRAAGRYAMKRGRSRESGHRDHERRARGHRPRAVRDARGASCGQAVRGAAGHPRRSRAARCARETHRRRCRAMSRYDPAAHAPGGRRSRSLASAAGRAGGARPARPDECARRPRHAARRAPTPARPARSMRSSPRPCRRA